MKLNECVKIKQTNNQEEVNEYLLKGYKILKIFSHKTKNDEYDEVRPVYILGLMKEA